MKNIISIALALLLSATAHALSMSWTGTSPEDAMRWLAQLEEDFVPFAPEDSDYLQTSGLSSSANLELIPDGFRLNFSTLLAQPTSINLYSLDEGGNLSFSRTVGVAPIIRDRDGTSHYLYTEAFPLTQEETLPFVDQPLLLIASYDDYRDVSMVANVSAVGGDAGWLASRILNFEMTKENAIDALASSRRSSREIAFQTIIKNRTFHGGILAAGSGFLKNGEAGKGILSRWYPSTLAKRMRNIDLIRTRLSFECRDAFEVLEENKKDKDAVFFIDPPYTAGGKKAGSRLYTHSRLDHERLFSVCSELSGDFIMTYDNAPEVKELARIHCLQAKPIAMKNTHHAAMTELVIGRNLEWMAGIDRVLEEQAMYLRQKKQKLSPRSR